MDHKDELRYHLPVLALCLFHADVYVQEMTAKLIHWTPWCRVVLSIAGEPSETVQGNHPVFSGGTARRGRVGNGLI